MNHAFGTDFNANHAILRMDNRTISELLDCLRAVLCGERHEKYKDGKNLKKLSGRGGGHD
jgi:hypothetical protein